jgi:hypothetical protein
MFAEAILGGLEYPAGTKRTATREMGDMGADAHRMKLTNLCLIKSHALIWIFFKQFVEKIHDNKSLGLFILRFPPAG